jgi:hypothetical protein
MTRADRWRCTVGKQSPAELWQQASGNPEEYRRLMRDHGHLVPGVPESLPCGWPRKPGGVTETAVDAPPYRILVTASRSWTDADAIAFHLDAAAMDALGRDVVVVHGAGGNGDRLAGQAAEYLGFTAEPHPADWEGPCRAECSRGLRRMRRDGTVYCPAAGNYRNQEMVDLGADTALMFALPCTGRKRGCPARPHDSHGAADCADRAKAAGIPVLRIRW